VEVDFFRPDTAFMGHDMEVRFFIDTLSNTQMWKLVDVTAGRVVADSQSDFSGELHTDQELGDYVVRVLRPFPVSSVTYTPEDNDPFDASGVGGQAYHAGLKLAEDFFFNSSLNRLQLVPVELRFDPAHGQKAYGYERLSPNGSYSYQGFGTVPFTAWDVSVTPNRQINVAFVQNYGDTTDTTPPRWLPDGQSTGGDVGGREYLAPLLSSYSETELPFYTEQNFRFSVFDQMYVMWLFRKQAADWTPDNPTFMEPRAGDVLRIELGRRLNDQDVFRFRYERTGAGEGSEVSNDLTRIRAVPNPYYAHSAYETNQFARRVKFTHLPNVRVTVRIFNLAGDLVRTLVRADVTQAEITWDLLNENRLPVASGVYLFHVDAQGLGKTVGRMAVFLEREKINFF
jgi:hypothetical protein